MQLKDLFIDYQSLPEYSGIELADVNQVSLFGDRPINVAATRGSIEELSTLVVNGASVNDAGEHGYTPLHNAVEQGMLEAVKWLLKNGADRMVRNTDGQTPMELAAALSEGEIEKLLAKG